MNKWLSVDYCTRYDRSKQSLKTILDVQLLTAMGLPEGGRASISPRLRSRFNIVVFLDPNISQINRIYQTLVVHKFSNFKEVGRMPPEREREQGWSNWSYRSLIRVLQDVKGVAEGLATATIALHQSVCQAFRPKPEKAHYLFSMRDISKVVKGLYQADPRCIEDSEVLLKLWCVRNNTPFKMTIGR